jgi:histidinol-phosphate aminotransferase
MRTDGDIAIVGAGYVGLTSAACFCEMGHRVRLVEVNANRVAQIRAGQCPIFEQGLPELLGRHFGYGLSVYDDLAAAVTGARAVFVCVGTPPKSGGAPDLGALSALVAWAPTAHLYPDGSAYRLKARLADLLEVEPEQVIVGNGSDEIIKLLAEAFLNPGDEIVMADPTFSEYEFAALLMGARVRKVPLKENRHDLEAMAAAVTSRTKLVFLCNPNNPTGTTVGRRAVEQFLDAIPREVIVVFDQAYQEYVTEPEYADGLAYVKSGRRSIVLRTFSKIYGLAGLRVGYGVAPVELLRLAERAREPFNVNQAAQVAALAALEDQGFVTRSRDLNLAERTRLTLELERRHFTVIPSQANFIFAATGVQSVPLFKELLKQGVIVRTGDIFGRPDHIRVTVGTPVQNDRFLAALDTVLPGIMPEGGEDR